VIIEKSYKNLMKNLGRTYANLWKTYDDITRVLWKRKIQGKWCHSV